MNWRNFGSNTDIYKLLALFTLRKIEFQKPFEFENKIVVRMSDDYAFIFTMEGKLTDD